MRDPIKNSENTGATGVTTSIGDPTTNVYYVARNEIIIDRLARDIWPVLIDTSYENLKPWNPTVLSVTPISGEPEKVGELIMITKVDDVIPPFYQRTIRLVPLHQRVLHISAVDGKNAVFVDHSLYESDGKTKMVYNGYMSFIVPVDQAETVCQKTEEVTMPYLNECMQLLKQLVESK